MYACPSARGSNFVPVDTREEKYKKMVAYYTCMGGRQGNKMGGSEVMEIAFRICVPYAPKHCGKPSRRCSIPFVSAQEAPTCTFDYGTHKAINPI